MKILAALLAAAFLAASLWTGGRAAVSDLRVVFRDAPIRTIDPALTAQAQAMKRQMRPGTAVLFIENRVPADPWRPRLWQRAFYPTRLYVLKPAPLLKRSMVTTFRDVYGAPYALAIGSPPADPGFRSYRKFPAVPGTTDEAWFGELVP